MNRSAFMDPGGWAVIILMTLAATAPVAATENLPEIPNLSSWITSPHADRDAEAFRHWDKEGAVPVACAKCHSSGGFRDFVGADGSEVGVVDKPAATDTVITCVTCHSEQTLKMDEVEFPSGAFVEDAGRSMRCMQCHQGRQSTVSVHEATDGLDPDTASDKLHFLNIHYRAAGATLYGTEVKGAYEYPGLSYRGRSRHITSMDACTECHDVHSTRVRVERCAECHQQASSDLHGIRMSQIDFDGDGQADEGLAHEIEALRGILMSAIQGYARSVAGKAVAYDPGRNPYFFSDNDGNGIADPTETEPANRYRAWTPRLLKAAYNYQFVTMDPGAFAHNGRYVVQVLHDSIQDLAKKVPVDTARLQRP
jgi:hypothetical protein